MVKIARWEKQMNKNRWDPRIILCMNKKVRYIARYMTFIETRLCRHYLALVNYLVKEKWTFTLEWRYFETSCSYLSRSAPMLIAINPLQRFQAFPIFTSKSPTPSPKKWYLQLMFSYTTCVLIWGGELEVSNIFGTVLLIPIQLLWQNNLFLISLETWYSFTTKSIYISKWGMPLCCSNKFFKVANLKWALHFP